MNRRSRELDVPSDRPSRRASSMTKVAGNARPSRLAVLLTCEHASARVPARFSDVFRSHAAKTALRTHRGSDHHAAPVGRALAKSLANARIPFSGPIEGKVTRLLVDLNRSLRHPALFSEFSRRLSDAHQSELLRDYYAPHQAEVRAELDALLRKAAHVVHIGVHSFTPVLQGEERNADIGLLYDPGRPREHAFARAARTAFLAVAPELRVRLNYPYRGIADGLTTALRRELGDPYVGIELELNQGTWQRTSSMMMKACVAALTSTLQSATFV